MIRGIAVFIAIPLLLASACDDHHDHEHSATSVNEAIAEACEHLQSGPATTITATDEATGAKSGYHAHKRVDVTLLPDGDGGYGGFVKLDVPEAGEAAFVIDADVILTLSKDGQSLTSTSSQDNHPSCPSAARVTTFDVTVGRHELEIRALAGTTTDAMVGYVMEIFTE